MLYLVPISIVDRVKAGKYIRDLADLRRGYAYFGHEPWCFAQVTQCS